MPAIPGRLALDRGLEGRGLGAQLLADALARIIAASRSVNVRVVVVDAIDQEAAGFSDIEAAYSSE